jgi:hypothetical protein
MLSVVSDTPSQTPSDYQITIDGKQYDLDLDKDSTFTTASGATITVKVHKKEVQTYHDDFVTFQHASAQSVNKAHLGDGLDQVSMVSGVGTALMVQEYANFDSTAMVDLLMNQLTKQDVQTGYQNTETDVSRTLSDGTLLKGKESLLTYGNEQTSIVVLAYNEKDHGVAVVAQVDKDNAATDKVMIDSFWNTLTIKKPAAAHDSSTTPVQ